MNTLRDMPMITNEQKNRFREAALQVENERDELAAHVDRMTDVFKRLHLKSPSPIEVLQAYSYVMRGAPAASLAARDARMKAEALEPLREKFQRDAGEAEEDGDVTAQLHWLRTVMHVEILQKKYRKQAESKG